MPPFSSAEFSNSLAGINKNSERYRMPTYRFFDVGADDLDHHQPPAPPADDPARLHLQTFTASSASPAPAASPPPAPSGASLSTGCAFADARTAAASSTLFLSPTRPHLIQPLGRLRHSLRRRARSPDPNDRYTQNPFITHACSSRVCIHQGSASNTTHTSNRTYQSPSFAAISTESPTRTRARPTPPHQNRPRHRAQPAHSSSQPPP